MLFAFSSSILLLPLLASAFPLRLITRDNTTTSSSNSTSGSNSTGTINGLDADTYALELIILDLQIMDTVLNAGLLQASPLNDSDPQTQLLIGTQNVEQTLLNQTQNLIDFNCSISLGDVTQSLNPETVTLGDAAVLVHHYAGIIVTLGNAFLSNSSLTLNDSTKAILNQAVVTGEAIDALVSSVTFIGTNVLQYPEMTIDDIAASLGFFNITCSNDQGENLPLPSAPYKPLIFQAPFLEIAGANIGAQSNVCSGNTTCFCQTMFSDSNRTISTTVSPIQNCTMPNSVGTGLMFVTDEPDPLSVNASDRVQQESSILFVSMLTLVTDS